MLIYKRSDYEEVKDPALRPEFEQRVKSETQVRFFCVFFVELQKT